MESDYFISKKELVEMLFFRHSTVYDPTGTARMEISSIIDVVRMMPAAIVRPVARSEWKHIGNMTIECQNCKEQFHELEADNYCPNCGAYMKGKKT